MTTKIRLLALVAASLITASLLAGTASAAGGHHSNQVNQGVAADKQPGSSAPISTTRNITRGQTAVFIIRAKMNNVYPTSLSGNPSKP